MLRISPSCLFSSPLPPSRRLLLPESAERCFLMSVEPIPLLFFCLLFSHRRRASPLVPARPCPIIFPVRLLRQEASSGGPKPARGPSKAAKPAAQAELQPVPATGPPPASPPQPAGGGAARKRARPAAKSSQEPPAMRDTVEAAAAMQSLHRDGAAAGACACSHSLRLLSSARPLSRPLDARAFLPLRSHSAFPCRPHSSGPIVDAVAAAAAKVDGPCLSSPFSRARWPSVLLHGHLGGAHGPLRLLPFLFLLLPRPSSGG